MSDLSTRIANLSATKRALLAERLGREKSADNRARGILRKNRSEAPLSFAQQRIWFLHQLEPDSPVYNIPAAVRLKGDINIKALEQSLNEIVRRHDVLRTSFPASAGQPRQVIAPRLIIALPLTDLSELPEPERERRARQLVTEEAARPFDLAIGPPLRSRLFRLSEQEYILTLTMNHIVSDGWSTGILIQELTALYEAFSEGRPSPLADPPIQYADFAQWQREKLQGEALPALLSYWKQQLAGANPVLDLPFDRPRPAVQSFCGASETFAISKSISESLAALGKQEEATMFMTLLAAFKVLLSKYTGQDDILVGTPLAGRNRSEVEGLIGFFVNTLVLRTDMSGNPSFRELLRQVKETAFAAYAHHDLPFEKLVEELKPERNIGHTPLFQVMFVLQNAPQKRLTLPGLSLSSFEFENRTAKFDLSLSLTEGSGELRGGLDYNVSLFNSGTIKRMAEHFQNLLNAVATNPDLPLAQIPILSQRERHQIINDWNDTRAPYPLHLCVHELFQTQVLRSPDALALVFQDQALTYRQLNNKANQLARFLRRAGVGPDTPVGISMQRSFEMVIAILATLKAGGAYLPLDPSYPPQRLAYMIEDAAISHILIQQRFVGSLPAYDGALLSVDTDWEKVAGESEQDLDTKVSGDNLAYIIYTSGSTGRPKGAMNTQRGISNRIQWMQDQYRLNASDVVMQKTPYSFDVSVWEFIWPLVAGAKLVVARPGGHQESKYLIELIKEQGVTVLHFVPSMLRVMLEEEGVSECESIRLVISSGEALSKELVEGYYEKMRGELENLYGPTEAAVDVTRWKSERGAERVLIGKPISNTEIYIVDKEMEAVGIGVGGEILIGGEQVGRGYLGRADMTGEKYIADGISGKEGARLYRTGDIGRWREGGEIEYIGRVDEQVKVRGYRIEMGEIEEWMKEYGGVKEAVVMAREEEAGGKRLVGYVVPKDQGEINISDLRSYLKQRLPEYMVPSAFVMLSEIPLTSSGKVNRRALPAPDQTRPDIKAYEAPRSEAERILADIWQQVLRIEKVSVTDNFFELGGDSILSIQIIARANQRGLHLTARQMFQHQTVEELAEVAGLNRAVEAEQGRVSGDVPLMPIQRWFFEQEIEDRNHFNQSVLFEVDEEVRADWIEEIVGLLLEHHDALRMRYSPQAGGEWKQTNLVAEPNRVYEYVDLSQIEEGLQRAAIERACEQAQESLNIQSGPMIRVVQMGLGEGKRGRLLIVIHHLVVDGVSWRVLLEEIQSGYEQKQRGEQIRLAAKTTSFKRWAELLEQHLHSKEIEQEAEYWMAQSDNPISLPLDYENGLNARASERRVTVKLDEEETRTLLREVAEAYHTQINEVLLAPLVESLGKWTGSRRLLIDLEGHGREELFEDADVTRTIGWFTSLHPVLLEVEGCGSPGDSLKKVKEQMRAIPGRGIGYGLLKYLASDQIAAQLNRKRKAEICFNYLGQFNNVLSEKNWLTSARESMGPTEANTGKRIYLLAIDATVINGQLQISWSYSRNIHSRETIERLAAGYVDELKRLIARCRSQEKAGHAPSDFPLARLNQQELDSIIQDGDQIEDIYPLSPVQQGLLFHALYDGVSSVYVMQCSCLLKSEVDTQMLKQAWQKVVDRHPVLRTAFVWQNVSAPLQVVHRQADLTWEEQDWRGVPEGEQQERLESFFRTNRERGIELSTPPLMALSLIRMADDAYQLTWKHHHLILDGWSPPLLLKEVFTLYDALSQSKSVELEPSRPYSDYIAWLQQQDLAKAEEFWREALAGFAHPTPLRLSKNSSTASNDEGRNEQQIKLPSKTTSELSSFARRHQLTLNTIVQGAWALLLKHYSGEDDIVYGATVSGRPPDLPGVETIVGIFINTLPMRVRVSSQETLTGWLKSLQAQSAEVRQYDYTPLSLVQRCSPLPKGVPLFESIFVFQNFPVDESLRRRGGALNIRDPRFFDSTSYPIDVTVTPGPELAVKIIYDRSRFDGATIDRVLEQIAMLLTKFIEREDIQLSTLEDNLKTDQISRISAETAQRNRANRERLMGIKPKAVNVAESDSVTMSCLQPASNLPLVIQPAREDVDLVDWAKSNRQLIENRLLLHGAILFRGFRVKPEIDFELFAASICSELFNENGEHPRKNVNGNVYTPVFYPPHQQLLWHNENSFNQQWPQKIWFCCVQPAQSGGETPIVDSRKMYELMDPKIKRLFEEKKVMYMRNYGEGLGLDWQTVFQTEDRSVVEQRCKQSRMQCEWREDNLLRTKCVRPAVIPHTQTGEMSWFNQAQHWHISCLGPEIQSALLSIYKEEDLPRHCYFGDGTRIEDSIMEEILGLYRRLEVKFSWQKNDIILLDNILTAHGRNPFVGERKLLVAMGQMNGFQDA